MIERDHAVFRRAFGPQRHSGMVHGRRSKTVSREKPGLGSQSLERDGELEGGFGGGNDTGFGTTNNGPSCRRFHRNHSSYRKCRHRLLH